MTSAEFWERCGNLTPVEMLALRLRAMGTRGDACETPQTALPMARNGSLPTPSGSGSQTSGEGGAPLP
jgi:hypothetical protein